MPYQGYRRLYDLSGSSAIICFDDFIDKYLHINFPAYDKMLTNQIYSGYFLSAPKLLDWTLVSFEVDNFFIPQNGHIIGY